MSDTDDDVEEVEENAKEASGMKNRQKQFLEERFSTITPKSKEEAPPSAEKESKSTDSTLKENFRQDLMKEYRKNQKHKIEDE